jgi:hypothetical protein
MHFVIYAPSYDENSGGALVLYKLYALLLELGHEAYLQPFVRGDVVERSFWGFRHARTLFYRYRLRSYYQSKSPYPLRFASPAKLKDAVVVYPEVIEGNPMGAKKVVRWLLHRPGFHTGVVNYGPDDLYFYFGKKFDAPALNKYPDNHLRVTESFPHVYAQKNFGPRAGACYLVRKGIDRTLDYHPAGAELLDGKSHAEMAEAFNKYEYFYSYDLYTMYSRFAAVCGCKSIVVPEKGLDIDQWRQSPSSEYGLAYGIDDLPRAEATRPMLLEVMAESENESRRSVDFFVRRCQQHFG